MSEWEAYIDFGRYKLPACFWARNEAEAKKYCKKHYPQGVILSLKNLSKEQ